MRHEKLPNKLFFGLIKFHMKILYSIIVILVTVYPPSAKAESCTHIPDSECEALYALYNATNGDEWRNSDNWLSSKSVSTWYGITIDLGHVVEISLNNNGLTGPLPPELGNLSSLQYLSLGNNHSLGNIPPELSNLPNLKEILIWDSDLTGSIPKELGNLKYLKTLDLSSNSLSGTIPPELGNLWRLEYLYLGENDLTGSIPTHLTNPEYLRSFYLSKNDLTGPIPPEFGELKHLEWLSLHSNRLEGNIPSQLGKMGKLESLDLHSNNLTGSIPPNLGNLSELYWLNLSSNSLNGPIPGALGNLPRLWYLRLNSNSLSGELPAFLNTTSIDMDLRWNCLYSSDPVVLATVEKRHSGGFLSTQTISPKNVTSVTMKSSGKEENRIMVSWNPITYIDDEGGYQLFYRKGSQPGYEYYDMTADKKTVSILISDLEQGAEYSFYVNTVTRPHPDNKNELQSSNSNPASAVSGFLSRAFIPIWKQAPEYFTGVVAANFGNSDFDLDLAAYGPNGVIEPNGHNHRVISAGWQMSKLGWELFHGDPYHEGFSWIELKAENSNKMGSIFLYGVSDTQMLDGAEAQSTYAKKLYFTRPLDEGFFAGWGPKIQMCIVNPTDEEATVNCTLIGSSGESTTTHTIPSKGFITGNSADLVKPDHGIVDGFMEIETTGAPGVIGFSRIEFPGVRTALGMDAVQATASNKFYSAQLAHGMNIVTNLRLVNTSRITRSVTLSAIGDDGTELANPVIVEIPAKRIFNADMGTILGLEGNGVVTTGSLVIEADGNGIIGDIIFANGDTLEYAMALPLQKKLFTEAVFNHIANLPSVFTGFAFYNPGDEYVLIFLEAFGTNGQKVAEKTLILDPGERISRTLTDPDMWPDFPTQSGGYIKIQSSHPIAGQQLFGDRSLRYMAAIPPTTRLEAMFD